MDKTFKQIKEAYEMCRVGEAVYVDAIGVARSNRVVGVGYKYIHLAGGKKVQAKDIVDWWK